MAVSITLARNGIYSKEWNVSMDSADDTSATIAHNMDDSPWVWIIPTETLSPEVRIRKLSASPTPGTGDAYGDAISLTPSAGYECFLIPRTILVTFGGTFATDETVTARITFNWETASATSITVSGTATGTSAVADADIDSAIADSDKLLSIDVDAKSNQSSTSVTVDVSITIPEVGKKAVYLSSVDSSNITINKPSGNLPISFKVLALAHSIVKKSGV